MGQMEFVAEKKFGPFIYERIEKGGGSHPVKFPFIEHLFLIAYLLLTFWKKEGEACSDGYQYSNYERAVINFKVLAFRHFGIRIH